MIGLIVQLLISWLIIWLVEKKSLFVLGFLPTRQRVKDFLLVFLLTAACCTTGVLLKLYAGHQQWVVNPKLSADLIFEGTWWNIMSVLFEELIFRGVLLYILIKRLGPLRAIIISAVAFGIYHWFSFGVIGNVPQMIIVFLTTGVMGLLLAYGYSKTFSLYIPLGIHLGWNLTQIFVFSQGPIGNGIFIPADPAPFRTGSYFIFFAVTFLPMILAMALNFLYIKKHRQSMLV